MLATVTGTYKNGQITLDEDLPVKTESAKVIVTLVEESTEKRDKPVRTPGLMKGSFIGDYWFSEEFNEPLDDLKDYFSQAHPPCCVVLFVFGQSPEFGLYSKRHLLVNYQ